jgi:isopentenyl-diphosphate delta-isomerase
MISGMTGGPDSAGAINRELARVAQEYGLAFGLGSQRPMLDDEDAVKTYAVRDVAPTVFLCGNIGFVQAAAMSSNQLEDLVGQVDANALCIHLNPAQELIQDSGDRDFRGCIDGIARAVESLDVPVLGKETGSGMSRRVLRRLFDAGVRTVDVSGAGGTTWVGVEALRGAPETKQVGAALWEWGIPTAASVMFAKEAGHGVIASGGIRTGLDCAKAIALGANVASCALPFLQAAHTGGADAAAAVASTMLRTLRTAMLLTGSSTIAELESAPKLIGPNLNRWIQ